MPEPTSPTTRVVSEGLVARITERLERLPTAYRAKNDKAFGAVTIETRAAAVEDVRLSSEQFAQSLRDASADSAVAAARLGISKASVETKIDAHELLGWEDKPGKWLLPNSQFMEDGTVLPRLVEVLVRLSKVEPDLEAIAGWMASPHPSLEDSSPLKWMCEHSLQDTDLVLEAVDAIPEC